MVMATYNSISHALKGLGLTGGDVVMVHSSLKSFGYVEGGAATVIEAITGIIGSNGTLIMQTFTLSFISKESPVLNILNTPSETGYITEQFRQMKGVHRSKHITHSVAAWGALGSQIASLPCSTAWGFDSPFQLLHENNGKILMLGVGYNRCTMIHKVEQDLQVPYRQMRSFPNAKTVLPDGRIEKNNTKLYYLKENFKSDLSKISDLIENAVINRTVMIGNAKIKLALATDIYEFVKKRIEQDPEILLGKE